MSFLDHLEILRWHVIRSAIAVVLAAIAIFVLGRNVFDSVIFAPLKKDFITYRIFCNISEATCLNVPKLQLIRKELGEEFFIHIKVSIFLGIAVAMPYILWEIWKFIKPGLYAKEQKHARGFVLVCSSLFTLGMLFGYFVICPFAVSYLSNYSIAGEVVEQTATLSSYIGSLTMFCFPTGVIFQLPVVAYFLSKIGVLHPSFMKKFRRHAYVVLLILAAIITPPDIITQVLICIPLYLLYEVSIFISARVTKQNKLD